MERRDLFKIIAATPVLEAGQALAQHQHASTTGPFPGETGYKMKFLTSAEEPVIDRLADIIIPADSRSPGAHDARVVHFIDLFAHYGGPAIQQRWRDGVAAVETESKRRHGKAFASLDRAAQEAIVATMASNEGNPGTALEHFFALLKQRTLDGFRYSRVGLDAYFGYKGDIPSREFVGCNHPEHQRV
ncbi:MAG: gluconate 2-dehydrogenase subunit 3 family protein [Acidobacteria bacterium]|nr:gluconate 2-dehydrogenase subunit 3 family protein [Acidobacteriota bacterium]